MDYEEIIKNLHLLANPENLKGMARYGINQKNNLGISIYQLRPLANEIGKNHVLDKDRLNKYIEQILHNFPD